MPYYRQVGEVPRKRHTIFNGDDGARRHEQLMGQEGFSSRSALLYHRSSPSAITAIEPIDAPADTLERDQPLTPRHVRTGSLAPAGDVVLDRRVLFGNSDVRVAFAAAAATSPLYRNAVGDELVYVQSGTARLESVFGALDVGPGDYVVIPCGSTHRIENTGSETLVFVEVQYGEILDESDITRIDDDYSRS